MLGNAYLYLLIQKASYWCELGNYETDPRWQDVCFQNARLLHERIMHICDVLGW